MSVRVGLWARLRDFWIGGLAPQHIGVVAEFEDPRALLRAVERLRAAGLEHLDAYVPHAVEGLDQALGLERSRIPRVVALFGFGAATLAYLLLWWINVVALPRNVGARPLHPAPAFLPVVFEAGILVAGTTAVVALFLAGGMPRLWHPVFEVEGFESASVDRYWLGVDRADPAFDANRLLELLGSAGALRVSMIEEVSA